MEEFELRFKKPEGIEDRIQELGFSKKESFQMHDLIFEPKTWEPGSDLKSGYFVIRIRLVENKRPAVELKAFMEENRWDEVSLDIDDPQSALDLFSSIMVRRRVISKQREVWIKDNVEIVLDDVTHLGPYIEIEGEESEVRKIAEQLNLKDSQMGYGRLLFYLEKEGKISFDSNEMNKIVDTFKYLKK
ncbi:MAG: CYTH domain-containing protein [Candidatus Aenigmarchaeota archaeon]|nr:CYTH domain-containing protein [Candidatus Aenigmarchaeota archaeon]